MNMGNVAQSCAYMHVNMWESSNIKVKQLCLFLTAL